MNKIKTSLFSMNMDMDFYGEISKVRKVEFVSNIKKYSLVFVIKKSMRLIGPSKENPIKL